MYSIGKRRVCCSVLCCCLCLSVRWSFPLLIGSLSVSLIDVLTVHPFCTYTHDLFFVHAVSLPHHPSHTQDACVQANYLAVTEGECVGLVVFSLSLSVEPLFSFLIFPLQLLTFLFPSRESLYCFQSFFFLLVFAYIIPSIIIKYLHVYQCWDLCNVSVNNG